MGSTGLYVLGGLLGGVGKAIENDAERRRQDALLALKRNWDVQDSAAKEAASTERTKLEIAGRKELVQATGAENRATELVKTAGDQANIKLRASLDYTKDVEIEKLKHTYQLDEITARSLADTAKEMKLAHITPDHYEVMANGQIVVWKKDGTAYVKGADGSFVPRGSKNDDEDGIDTIGGAKASRGSTPAPKKQASPGSANIKAQAKAQLGTLVAEIVAHPEKKAEYRTRYPAMFDAQGNLKPTSELLAQVDARYGG